MQIKNINRPKGHNKYCGPAVLSAVTGCTTNEAATVIRHHTGQRAVRGASVSGVCAALRSYGIATELSASYPRAQKPTLAGWLKATTAVRTPGRVFLVLAGSHYQLISGRRYVCGIVGAIVSIKDKAVKRRARVRIVYELTAPGGIKLNAELQKKLSRAAIEKQAASKEASTLAKLKREAAALGVQWEKDRESGTFWLTPDSSWTSDPIDDGHCAHDAWGFDEVLQHYRDGQATHRKLI